MVEVLVATAVISLALLAMLLANTSLQRSSGAAYERMVATQDAHRVIETMRNTASAGIFPANVTAAFPNGAPVAGFNNLSNEQVVVAYANPALDPLDITVTTNWREHGVRNTSIQLRTFMTQRSTT